MLRYGWLLALVGLVGIGLGCSSRRGQGEDIFDKVERAKYQPPAPEQGLEPLDMKLAFFAFDSSELLPHAKAVLAKHAAWMRANPEAIVQIEGFSDERGSNSYNLQLGERRALAAKRFLLAQGIEESRVTIFSFGRVPDKNPLRWKENRRTGFVVIYPNAE